MRLVLGSTSPYRRELLSRLKIPFEVASPEVDETPMPGESPEATALRLAELKARAVGTHFSDALVVGSDQVAVVDGAVLGKPGNFVRAREQLRGMRGRSVVFHTALALLNTATGRLQSRIVPTVVHLRDFNDAQIDAYLRKDEPYNCAGSARTESLGIALIRRIDTEDTNALIGLPLIALTEMLANEGLDVLTY